MFARTTRWRSAAWCRCPARRRERSKSRYKITRVHQLEIDTRTQSPRVREGERAGKDAKPRSAHKEERDRGFGARSDGLQDSKQLRERKVTETPEERANDVRDVCRKCQSSWSKERKRCLVHALGFDSTKPTTPPLALRHGQRARALPTVHTPPPNADSCRLPV